MQQQPISDYVAIGLQLRFLRGVAEGSKLNGTFSVHSNFKRFLASCENFGLIVTYNFSKRRLQEAIEQASAAEADPLDQRHATKIRSEANIVSRVLQAELSGRVVYQLDEGPRHGAAPVYPAVTAG